MNIQIPGYEVIRELGEGGMGIVYLAKEQNLETLVAIKLLHRQYSSKDEIRERFKNEARMMSVLVHTNIVQFRQFLSLPDGLALVMKFVEGRGLDRMIGEEFGPIPWEKAMPIFKQVLKGVGYAHSKGVVHRDIKPSNIIVSESGEVKVADFGIAKIAGQSGLTRTGIQMGTLYYESPEQIRGAKDVDSKSDIYSLGMTLYEMLAGRLPFDSGGDTSEFEITQQIVFHDHTPPDAFYPHIPAWLVNVVNKAIEKNPADRFQSCEEFAHALNKQSVSSSNSKSEFNEYVVIPGRNSPPKTVIDESTTILLKQPARSSGKSKFLIPIVISAVLIAVVLILNSKESVSSSEAEVLVAESGEEQVSVSTTTSPTIETQQSESFSTDEPFDRVHTIRPEVISALASSCRNRLIQNYELDDLSYREMKLVRNYFFAYYNRPFNTAWIREYFQENMPEYRATGESDPPLTDTERANVNRIIEYERNNNIPVMNY